MKSQLAALAPGTETALALADALLASHDDLTLVLDEALRVLVAGPRVQTVLGPSAGELSQRVVTDIGLFAPSAATLLAALRRALAGEPAAPLELHHAGEDGTQIYSARIVRLRGPASGAALLLSARDVTEQRRAEAELRIRERDFRMLAENSPDAIIRYGHDLRATYCNREIESAVTVTAMRIVGRTPAEAAPPGMLGVAAYETQLAHTLATGECGSVELVVPHPDGGLRTHNVVFVAERDAAGAVCAAVAVGRDVTDLVQAQQALARKESEFRTLAENAGDNIVRWDRDGRLLYFNPAMARVFGHKLEHALGRTPSALAQGLDIDLQPVERAIARVVERGEQEMIELRFRQPGRDAEVVHQIRLVPERDEAGQVTTVLGFGRDITEKIAQLELIESLVRTDPLTQLANRRALVERAPALLALAQRRGTRAALMLLDLDQFKAINDGLGHGAGDELLVAVAGRLAGCLRVTDLLVRLGGDEFVIVSPDVDDDRALGALAARVHGALSAPVEVLGRSVRISASIGVAVFPHDGEEVDALLAQADTAMYHAKRSGRARTEYFRAELGEAVQRRLVLEQSLRDACHGEGFHLLFQPLVHLDDPARVAGAEALLRWQHPTLGLVMPDAFIPLAEETATIVPLGRWVLRTAAAAVVRWNRGRREPLHVSVNVATRQIVDDTLPEVIDEVLAATGCDPRWLRLEITESALLEDSLRVQDTLQSLRDRGIRVAIDDFGTGYSALNYLGRFSLDGLKIDKSFVQRLGCSPRDDELVKAFIALSEALNLSTVAEGVETQQQSDILLRLGCRMAQGWRFGRPMDEAAFLAAAQQLRATA
jgi:diguanylate cyclase (GGDEF)-like protein/PAS domain S-box-containing protein